MNYNCKEIDLPSLRSVTPTENVVHTILQSKTKSSSSNESSDKRTKGHRNDNANGVSGKENSDGTGFSLKDIEMIMRMVYPAKRIVMGQDLALVVIQILERMPSVLVVIIQEGVVLVVIIQEDLALVVIQILERIHSVLVVIQILERIHSVLVVIIQEGVV